MKKLFSLSLILISVLSFSQIAMSSGTQTNRWTFGGGLGVGFGSDSYFNLQVSPRSVIKSQTNWKAALSEMFPGKLQIFTNRQCLALVLL